MSLVRLRPMKWTLYHNPKCSKSRATLALLNENGIEPKLIEYLKTPPTTSELAQLVSQLGVEAKAIVRQKESVFQELDLNLDDEAAVLAAIEKHPVLLERPILTDGSRAAVGRPPENILPLIS